MNINQFTDPYWKLGGLTNPSREVRKEALRVVLQAVEIADMVGCGSVGLWPGSDGWDYNFEADYGDILNYFIDGCIAINKKTKQYGLRFGTEAKLHEPREGNMVVSTTTKAMLVAKEVNSACGGANMGVCIDYGHEQMYGAEPADMLFTARRFGVPITNFHLNNAKHASNDEDRVTGTGDNWALADFCYAAIVTGYDGWFGEDQFTYRQDGVRAMSLSRELFANIMKKALIIYTRRDALKKARMSGDSSFVIDVVKDVLV
jgi:xylose isomerase